MKMNKNKKEEAEEAGDDGGCDECSFGWRNRLNAAGYLYY